MVRVYVTASWPDFGVKMSLRRWIQNVPDPLQCLEENNLSSVMSLEPINSPIQSTRQKCPVMVIMAHLCGHCGDSNGTISADNVRILRVEGYKDGKRWPPTQPPCRTWRKAFLFRTRHALLCLLRSGAHPCPSDQLQC